MNTDDADQLTIDEELESWHEWFMSLPPLQGRDPGDETDRKESTE